MIRRILMTVVLLTALGETGNCGFLISITRSIVGHVTDAETGQPIPNAVITIKWYKQALIAMGPTSFQMGPPTITVTDSNGNYRLPSKVWVQFRGPTDLEISADHWAYEGEGDGGNLSKFYKTHEVKGAIHFNAKLVRFDTIYRYANPTTLNISYDGTYFGDLRKARIPFDLKPVFEKWDAWTKINPSLFNTDNLQRHKQDLIELQKRTDKEIDQSWRESI